MSHEGSIASRLRAMILVGLGVLFLWLTIEIDLVIFAGVLLAIFLYKLAAIVARRTALRQGWALAVVVVAIAALIVAFVYFFAATILGQIDQLSLELLTAFHRVAHEVRQLPGGATLLRSAKPSHVMSADAMGRLFGVASNLVFLVGGIVVIAFFGLYIAAEPGVYERGLLQLFPVRLRRRAQRNLAAAADSVWHWMLGRLFSMFVVGIGTVAGLWLIGMQLPVVLGGIAAILTFVPYLGTVVSAVPTIVLALAHGPGQVLSVLILYTCVHLLEGYVLAPLVQRRAAHVPPAVTLGAQLLMGSFAGLLGVTFATPLAAALIPLIRKSYVEDVLESDAAAVPALGERQAGA